MTQKVKKIKSVAIIAATLSFGGMPGMAADLAGLPIALVCTGPGGNSLVGYLVDFEPDGRALYQSLGDLAVKVDANGLVEISEYRKAGDCAGKTIDELRALGRTIEAVQ